MANNITGIGASCTGCRACEQICPQKCISIQANSEGFLYPIVDEAGCVDCGLCLRRCAQGSLEKIESKPLFIGAFQNKEATDLFRSASGGVSDVAAKVVLQGGGLVFGAAYTEDLVVKHIAVESDKDRFAIQSSKYVQSDTSDSYSQARNALECGRSVLFTGTPCQIDGLKCFLGKDYANLYTLDLICHGVPSPLLFKKYTNYMGNKMGEPLVEYNFRSKEKKGWGTQYLAKTKTKTKTKTKLLALDKYGKHFLSSDCYRECCYQCPYADIHKRPADMTVGDFWGVDKFLPQMSSKLGVSSIVVNTERGQHILEKMHPFAEITPISEEAILAKQGNLKKATVRPEERNDFYRGIGEQGFVENLKVGIVLKERVKAILPRKLAMMLKKILWMA